MGLLNIFVAIIVLQGYQICWGYRTIQICAEKGECLGGNILKILYDSPNPSECLKSCKDNENCKWFTHYDNKKVCVLKTFCQLSKRHCTHCISGQSICPLDQTCNINARCWGIMIDFPRTNDLKACRNKCVATHTCNWYTFNNVTKRCMMTLDCVEMIECKTCITSERACTDYKFALEDVLMLRQDLSAKVNTFDDDTIRSLNKDDTSALMYSRLEDLNEYRQADGKFYFKICYPNLSKFSSKKACYTFSQNASPEEALKRGILQVYGFSAPNNWRNDAQHRFRGLRADNNDVAYIDGDTNGEAFSIGAKVLDEDTNKIKGPHLTTGILWVDLVELYVRV